MAIILLVILVLAVIHFVYESILLPSIRLKLRFRMFALRDDLRTLLYERASELDPKVYDHMQETINTSIAFLYRFNIRTILEARRLFKDDPTLIKRAQKRMHEIETYPLEEFQSIRRQCIRIFAMALLANSAIFFLWASIPIFVIALIMYIFDRLNAIINELKSTIKSVICTPENEIERKLGSYGGVRLSGFE